MKKYWIIWREFLKLSIQHFVEYRVDFVVWAIISLAWTLFSILFYEIVFSQTVTIAGWSRSETFLLVGTYMIIDSATWGIFWKNIQTYTQSIYSGTFDYLLLQPIDVQFRVSVRHVSFNNFMRFMVGVYLLVVNFPVHVEWLQIVLYIAFVLTALIVVYALWFFSATFTFWAEKLDNIIEIVPALRSIWSVPADIYSGPLSTLFTIIIPLALITTVPTRALIGSLQVQETLIFIGFAALLLIATRLFFNFAIKNYRGAGS